MGRRSFSVRSKKEDPGVVNDIRDGGKTSSTPERGTDGTPVVKTRSTLSEDHGRQGLIEPLTDRVRGTDQT